MSSENSRLDRFEQLFDRLEEISNSHDADPEEVAIVSLLAMINDQLAFLRNQHETGRLPESQAQLGMQLLESPFVYGYLVGAGAYVGKAVENDTGGSVAIDAMREAFAELYGDHGERNWNSSQGVSDSDADFHSGLAAGAEDLRRFLSRLQGEDIGPTSAMAAYVAEQLNSPNASETPRAQKLGVRLPKSDDDMSETPSQEYDAVEGLVQTAERYSSSPNPNVSKMRNLICAAASLFGLRHDERLELALDKLYLRYVALDSAAPRFALYQEVVGRLERGETAHEALRVFLVNDDYPVLVSTAALDFSVHHPLVNGDPLTGPKEIVRMYRNGRVKCREGLFSGLLMLGDDRVCTLLRKERQSLTDAEKRVVCGISTGYLFASTIEFLLGWLEKAEKAGDDASFGLVAAALGNLPRNAAVPMVTSGRRRFPVDPYGEILEEGFEQYQIEDYAMTIEPRLRALADREPPPRVMPMVLGAWGLEP